jgi:geranylgeranyl pyrophosphate synthase/predicted secreted hydrolase
MPSSIVPMIPAAVDDVRTHPADWPAPGPIDLTIHDLPHASARMEWWYVNAHLTAADGRPFSLFAAFFVVDTSAADAADKDYSHFLTWGLVDADGRRHFPETRVDARSPSLAVAELDHNRGPRDPLVAAAFREVVAAGRIPLPDRLLPASTSIPRDRLALDFGGSRFTKAADGSYALDLVSADGQTGCRLRVTLEMPVVRHGDNGVVCGLQGESMFYYFSPRCRVEGRVLVDGAWVDVADGLGWYDHEFGESHRVNRGPDATVGWNWLSAQLDNGWSLTAYDLFDRYDATRSHGRWVVVVSPSGERTAYDDFTFSCEGAWTSTRTFNRYPTRYRLEVPRAGIALDVEVALPQQEVITIISAPAFWEGRVAVHGRLRDTLVTGVGFVERSGSSEVETTDDFLAAVSRETRRAIEALLPEHPTREQALALIGGHERFLEGADLEQYARTVLLPLREMVLRGGKSWRSYALLACMDAVGGDSRGFADWLAMPELLHVGSLIVDDVQDHSEIRRGGPALHRMIGDAAAINVGCASYFLAQLPVATSSLDPAVRVQVYEAYFDTIRAAHAGQAFDIDGFWHLMPEIVETGDGALLERRVHGLHRLKSGVPAGACARVAALIGGGSKAQVETLAALFESYGLAFQIVDDVLNLRGFDSKRKTRGEDITEGKVTAPVAKAMGRLSPAERRELWAILSSKPADGDRVARAIDLIDGCGALDACEQEARDRVEEAWRAVDPLLPDSQFKIRLRAFGWFVLDRHY